jgi:hypothetical protein
LLKVPSNAPEGIVVLLSDILPSAAIAFGGESAAQVLRGAAMLRSSRTAVLPYCRMADWLLVAMD